MQLKLVITRICRFLIVFAKTLTGEFPVYIFFAFWHAVCNSTALLLVKFPTISLRLPPKVRPAVSDRNLVVKTTVRIPPSTSPSMVVIYLENMWVSPSFCGFYSESSTAIVFLNLQKPPLPLFFLIMQMAPLPVLFIWCILVKTDPLFLLSSFWSFWWCNFQVCTFHLLLSSIRKNHFFPGMPSDKLISSKFWQVS